MSKGLEVLEKYKRGFITKEYEIIEKELKECEMEHTLRIRLENINYELVREKQENEKKLKALEIIKEKRVNVDYFLNNIKRNTDYKEYKRLHEFYKIMVISDKEPTQEEFNLLKEVLL